MIIDTCYVHIYLYKIDAIMILSTFCHLPILIYNTKVKTSTAPFPKTSISDLTQCCTEPFNRCLAFSTRGQQRARLQFIPLAPLVQYSLFPRLNIAFVQLVGLAWIFKHFVFDLQQHISAAGDTTKIGSRVHCVLNLDTIHFLKVQYIYFMKNDVVIFCSQIFKQKITMAGQGCFSYINFLCQRNIGFFVVKSCWLLHNIYIITHSKAKFHI